MDGKKFPFDKLNNKKNGGNNYPKFLRQTSDQEWKNQYTRRQKNQQNATRKKEMQNQFNQPSPSSAKVKGFRKKKKGIDEHFMNDSFKVEPKEVHIGKNFSYLSRSNDKSNQEPVLTKRQSFVDIEKKPEEVYDDNGPMRLIDATYVPQTIDKNKSIFDENPLIPLKRFKSFDYFAHDKLLNSQVIKGNPEEREEDFIINPNSDFPNFGKLLELLKKHFKGRTINDRDLSISDTELQILKAILGRKYKSQIDLNSHTIFLTEKLNEIANLNSKKRPEENYKFVFKRCIKFLKEDLKTKVNKKLSKKDFESYFYAYYFSKTAKTEKVSLDFYKHPQNADIKKNFPKTINMEYISHVKKSELFLEDFNRYVTNHLHQEYNTIIELKLEGLIKKWEESYCNSGKTVASLKEIIDYISHNKKCKLPWTTREIEEAVNSIRRVIAEDD